MMVTDNLVDGFGHFPLIWITTHGHDLKLEFIDVTKPNTHARAKGANDCQHYA
jgi:hypothetical protein